MDAVIALLTAPAQEALKSWGVFGVLVSTLGAALLWSLRQNSLKDAVIARLQEQRVEDAQRMILVAEHGTETMRARGANDVQLNRLLKGLGSLLDANRPLLPPPEKR